MGGASSVCVVLRASGGVCDACDGVLRSKGRVMAELGVPLDFVRARCAQAATRVKGMQRNALPTVVHRCAGRSSANGPDVGAVRPVGDVRGFSFRLRRSVWLDIYGGVWGC